MSLRTDVTLVLADQNPALATAHDELHPERVGERIPLSITLLYPWTPARPTSWPRATSRAYAFFGGRRPFEFAPSTTWTTSPEPSYAAPEPDDELRALMPALWARYPDTPPYGRDGSDPPPHATLARIDVPRRERSRASATASPASFRPVSRRSRRP